MKNSEFLWSFLLLATSTLVLSLPARAAQDQPLEITDVTYKSEDGTVASKLYKLKDLRGRAPQFCFCREEAATSVGWNG